MERDSLLEAVVQEFFSDDAQIRRSISVLCESSLKQNTDTITPTIQIMLSCPIQVQLTAIGWQPFKGKDLTYPFDKMSESQKRVFREALPTEAPVCHWRVFEHAIIYHKGRSSHPTALAPLNVLSSLCSCILDSQAHKDMRLRVAICNIILQRIQASISLDKHTQAALNERLFSHKACANTTDTPP